MNATWIYPFIILGGALQTSLPTAANISKMPWWSPLGGLVGAVQVYTGLTLVHKVSAGTFVGLTVTAALVMPLLPGGVTLIAKNRGLKFHESNCFLDTLRRSAYQRSQRCELRRLPVADRRGEPADEIGPRFRAPVRRQCGRRR
jgi:hypothetical protein